MYENVAGGSASFEELAKLLGTSKNNIRTKYTIWGSEAYGLVTKNEKNQYMLSETGRKIIAPTFDGEDSEAKVKAILTPTILSKFYTEYNKHPVPQDTFFLNVLETRMNIPRDRVGEAKEIILQNAKYAGILRRDSNSDREIINLEILSKELPNHKHNEETSITEESPVGENISEPTSNEKICFVICPIGEDSSIERKHSDLLLKHLIEPVLDTFGFKVIRADKIEKSGLITQQIFENLVKAHLCIADLSFNNPNVFYELGVRHMSQLPTIQVIRKGDKIPFDVSHGRTIIIDTSDVYTLIDRIDSAKKELTEYIKAISGKINFEISDDNPIRVYIPGVKVSIPK
ncbi:hypothetical protein [Cohnella sp. REN36]|uniref:hypothetical protein n=1 Tax=Cohnella sp. REN36 TaxID=2887347 RepID=UPI001D14CE30|nr:hypothetical protein [Cohnella sp. REN36]MCC3374137.1 hypothetical protein [Cohnella sp. REN36]